MSRDEQAAKHKRRGAPRGHMDLAARIAAGGFRCRGAVAIPILAVVLAAAASAEEPKTETRFSFSAGNEAAYAAGMRIPGPQASNLALFKSAFAWRRGDRWRFASSVAATAFTSGETHARLRVKETYFGVTLGDFDLLAGKKILKWGTGYAFTPTGVLDPPRLATDPTDRLDLNEGRELASIQWIKGRHAVTAAWASGGLVARHRPGMRETWATRYNALYAGFDTSVVVARPRGGPIFSGANFTRVVGEAWEFHGEFARARGTAFLLGGKYSAPAGINTIFEFFAPSGRDHPQQFPGSNVSEDRRYCGFFYVGKSRLRELPGWKEWDLGASYLTNFNDHSRILIFDANRRFGNHVALYGRVQAPFGERWRSEYGMIPYSALVSAGFRFQI